MPRRSIYFSDWAAPSVWGLAPRLWARGRTRGIAPDHFKNHDGEAEPRLTSGGEAVAIDVKLTFRAKLDKLKLTHHRRK